MGIFTALIGLVFAEARPQRFYAEIIHPTRQKTTHLVRLNGKNFTLGRAKYNVPDLEDESVIFYQGFWRVPSAEYYFNIKEPLKRGKIEPTVIAGKTVGVVNETTKPITAEDAFEATESHVISEVLRSFVGEAISQTMGFTLVLIAAVAGPVILYVVFNNKFRELTELAAQIAAAHGVQVR